MYDICHPTYYNMSQLGCSDQIKLTTAFYVYMELCEVKRYWNVEYKYNEKLLLFYLQAKKSKNGTVEIFIPWPAIHNLSLDLISNIQQELETEKFTFVFKEGDTTSVYYCISSGMIKPIPPDESKILKRTLRKKVQLEREIHKNAANLYERALFLNNDESHERENINSLNAEVDDEQMAEELVLEDIENGQSEVHASQSGDKSDLNETGDLVTEKSESKNENIETDKLESNCEDLETDKLESNCEDLETENSENNCEKLETENVKSNCENLESENFESNCENIETENFESKSECVNNTENTESKSENLESETSHAESNINNND